jgi:xanthine dehydrogenase YagS FAD-binding subunit
MKSLENINVGNIFEAVGQSQQARSNGQKVSFSGGGTDLLQQIKDGVITSDVLINLRTMVGNSGVSSSNNEIAIGGQVTLDELSNHADIQNQFTVLAEAAGSVATPQIRNVGTLAGNVMQRPWCWYYRNGFQCYKVGGEQCFSITGENQLNAIYGGGPSYIVHPSDTAPALVALDAMFDVTGPNGSRSLSGEDFFVLPSLDPMRENVLEDGELLTGLRIPTPASGTRSTYHKIMDRQAWTHAVISVAVVLQMDGDTCVSASIVLGGVAPIPWRVPESENLLAGRQLTAELARQAGEISIREAAPLTKNAYKLPMVSATVERAINALMSTA